MKIHLIGIGGIGVSGVGKLLRARGDAVTGSDLNPCDEPDTVVGHVAENVPDEVDLVVRSAAVPDDNPEVEEAKRRGVPVIKYAEMLGRLSGEKSTVAVAGCHGKTTTTAMVSYILSRAGFNPSFVCGGIVPQLGSSAVAGTGKHMVVEACEYDRSFLNLAPSCAVMTNIDEDHLDYYRDITEIVGAFREFALKSSGPVIGSADNPHTALILKGLKGKGEDFSLSKEADWRAREITCADGRWSFELLKYGRPYGCYTLSVPGEHNVANALAAIAAVTWAGVGQEIVQVALSEFTGAARRSQFLGERNGALVVDDYGHHPVEIQATLRALRQRYPDRKIWCIYQPHQRSRTRIMLKELARSFSDAHLVLLPEIFATREQDASRKISSSDLSKAIADNGKPALFLPTFEEILSFLRDKATSDCIVLTMGAGDVGDVARRFLED